MMNNGIANRCFWSIAGLLAIAALMIWSSGAFAGSDPLNDVFQQPVSDLKGSEGHLKSFVYLAEGAMALVTYLVKRSMTTLLGLPVVILFTHLLFTLI